MQRIIDEIKACQNEQYGFAALALALIIPDICASFTKGAKAGRYDYIDWCNNWIADPEDLDGKVIYSLRCSLLHSMDGNLEKQPVFSDYKNKKVSSGENRKLSYRFFFPHEDTKEAVIYKEESDTEIRRTLCTGLLIGSIIDAYERFEAENPGVSTHDFINFWFEG